MGKCWGGDGVGLEKESEVKDGEEDVLGASVVGCVGEGLEEGDGVKVEEGVMGEGEGGYIGLEGKQYFLFPFFCFSYFCIVESLFISHESQAFIPIFLVRLSVSLKIFDQQAVSLFPRSQYRNKHTDKNSLIHLQYLFKTPITCDQLQHVTDAVIAPSPPLSMLMLSHISNALA